MRAPVVKVNPRAMQSTLSLVDKNGINTERIQRDPQPSYRLSDI